MADNSKVMSAQQAIARFVRSGDCLALGGFATNRRAYGLVREIIRQGKRDLTLESGAAGGDVDMLVGAGCVRVMNISYIANSGYTMVCRRFREAVERGTLPVEDYSLDVQTIAYHGAALGLPYVPVKNMLGSDLERQWGISAEQRRQYPKLPAQKFVLADDPFHPGHRLCLVPTPHIDVACIHVQTASPEGICRIEGAPFQDADIAIAAKRTIVSCEQLVDDEELRRDPGRNTLPGLCVSAVVPLPWGAHPSQCHGHYDYDSMAFREYDQASRTQEGFDAYLQRTVHPTHEQYLETVGAERLQTLKIHPQYGYAPGLRRK